MSERKIRTYTSDDVDVTYDLKRCIHARECVRGLPTVFDVEKRPWVQPQHAAADAVADVVTRCPTGALHFERKDGGPAEPVPGENTIQIVKDGPLYVRGDIEITSADGGSIVLRDTRVALCRCGQSQDKPFCDNSHVDAGFEDAGNIGQASPSEEKTNGKLQVAPQTNGPTMVAGAFTITSADGETNVAGSETALCRCGGSGNKPFCDGTHTKINFEAD